MFFKTLGTMCKVAIGMSMMFAGLGATVAFGIFAFVGIPLLIVGLSLLSSAIDEIEIP